MAWAAGQSEFSEAARLDQRAAERRKATSLKGRSEPSAS